MLTIHFILVLDLEVYTRLTNYGILESTMTNKVFNDAKKVVLDKQSTAFFENGVAIGRYLLIVNKIRENLPTATETVNADFKFLPFHDL